jgi:hypothetical protein
MSTGPEIVLEMVTGYFHYSSTPQNNETNDDVEA